MGLTSAKRLSAVTGTGEANLGLGRPKGLKPPPDSPFAPFPVGHFTRATIQKATVRRMRHGRLGTCTRHTAAAQRLAVRYIDLHHESATQPSQYGAGDALKHQGDGGQFQHGTEHVQTALVCCRAVTWRRGESAKRRRSPSAEASAVAAGGEPGKADCSKPVATWQTHPTLSNLPKAFVKVVSGLPWVRRPCNSHPHNT